MPKAEDILSGIEGLLAKNLAEEAGRQLVSLMREMGKDELADWEADIRRALKRFYPKRRRDLTRELDSRLGHTPEAPGETEVSRRDRAAFLQLKSDLLAGLQTLSERFIFQWSTQYRDTLVPLLDGLRQVPVGLQNEAALSAHQGFRQHAADIFAKGRAHVIGERRAADPDNEAVRKSINGLSSFLDVIVEYYSARATRPLDVAAARYLRLLVSAVASGILHGYGTCQFGRTDGFDLLSQHARFWAHYTPFLTAADARSLSSSLKAHDFAQALTGPVAAALSAFDQVISRERDHVPLPILGQYSPAARTLEVALRSPPDSADPRPILVLCLLSDVAGSVESLKEASARGIHVILGPLRPEVREFAASDTALSRLIVPVARDGRGADPDIAVALLEDVLFRRRSRRELSAPLTYNFAREFPLHNLLRMKYYHVSRSSVRELMRAFDRRNGVRLWCSVRRSGKTTACFDLGSTTSNTVVVSQTCDSTVQAENADVFYRAVLEALRLGDQLPPDFLSRLVDTSAPSRSKDATRFVFVIDEYETLFGQLKAALRSKPELRYTVVQPLLNQMTAFTRDNLLVFLGQHPDAHYIMMDQNQLSPHVEQDPFPLFEHHYGTPMGEFAELVGKVLGGRLEFRSAFLDALHQETGGHPFLTVNLLIEFVDWLIDQKRPAASLRLDADDFAAFSAARLTTRQITLSGSYSFFREAARDAIARDSATGNPWLFLVYRMLRAIARESLDQGVSQDRFREIAADLESDDHGFSPDDLLRTGTQANFFQTDGLRVRPRIRILARISNAARSTTA